MNFKQVCNSFTRFMNEAKASFDGCTPESASFKSRRFLAGQKFGEKYE